MGGEGSVAVKRGIGKLAGLQFSVAESVDFSGGMLAKLQM
jgi:hypothetical protein